MNLSQAIWEKKYKEQRMVGVSLLDISIHSGPKKKKTSTLQHKKSFWKKKKTISFFLVVWETACEQEEVLYNLPAKKLFLYFFVWSIMQKGAS